MTAGQQQQQQVSNIMDSKSQIENQSVLAPSKRKREREKWRKVIILNTYAYIK